MLGKKTEMKTCFKKERTVGKPNAMVFEKLSWLSNFFLHTNSEFLIFIISCDTFLKHQECASLAPQTQLKIWLPYFQAEFWVFNVFKLLKKTCLL